MISIAKIRDFFGKTVTFPFDFGDTENGNFFRIDSVGRIYRYAASILVGEFQAEPAALNTNLIPSDFAPDAQADDTLSLIRYIGSSNQPVVMYGILFVQYEYVSWSWVGNAPRTWVSGTFKWRASFMVNTTNSVQNMALAVEYRRIPMNGNIAAVDARNFDSKTVKSVPIRSGNWMFKTDFVEVTVPDWDVENDMIQLTVKKGTGGSMSVDVYVTGLEIEWI